MAESTIRTNIDYDWDGRQTGFLRLPNSVHRSGYGWIPIPIVSIRNGSGPTALLVAGNHGDEYEGQVALMELIRTLDPGRLQGQLIILPALNFPAVMAGSRVSPLDGGNLNREFPGRADGTLTQMIAHYVTEVLAPRVDYSFDLHSGGGSLDYIPTLIIGGTSDPVRRAKLKRLVASVGLPYAIVFRGGGASGGRTLASVIAANGGLPLAAELGGAGRLVPSHVATTKAALARYLAAIGILEPGNVVPPPAQTRIVGVSAQDYLYSPENGLFEPYVGLGAEVVEGQPAGLIHFPDTPWREPVEVAFEKAGVVICERPDALVQRGDCLFHTGEPWPDAFA